MLEARLPEDDPRVGDLHDVITSDVQNTEAQIETSLSLLEEVLEGPRLRGKLLIMMLQRIRGLEVNYFTRRLDVTEEEVIEQLDALESLGLIESDVLDPNEPLGSRIHHLNFDHPIVQRLDPQM